MAHEVISTPHAFKSDFPVSQAVRYGNLVFCAGQIGIDPRTGKLVDGFEKQTEQTLENLKAVLMQAKSGFDKVLKSTVFLIRQSDVPALNMIYARYFPNPPPSRTCIVIQAGARPGVEVEIELIAYGE